jgi:hypothetical protein
MSQVVVRVVEYPPRIVRLLPRALPCNTTQNHTYDVIFASDEVAPWVMQKEEEE